MPKCAFSKCNFTSRAELRCAKCSESAKQKHCREHCVVHLQKKDIDNERTTTKKQAISSHAAHLSLFESAQY